MLGKMGRKFMRRARQRTFPFFGGDFLQDSGLLLSYLIGSWIRLILCLAGLDQDVNSGIRIRRKGSVHGHFMGRSNQLGICLLT